MPRQKISATTLNQCLQGHLIPDVAQGYETTCQFLKEYEMQAGVVNNLMAAKKHLQQAVALCKAADVITEYSIDD